MKVLILLAAVACASAYYMPYNYYGNWHGAYGYAAAPYAYNGYHGYAAAPYYGYRGYAAPYRYHGYAAAPYHAASQYHAQDEFGGASYGHVEPFQSHVSNSDAFGRRSGSYSYLSPEGKTLRFDYTADERGFRVASNALPVAPKADLKAPVFNLKAPVDTGVAPMPVDFTPEVKEATAAHMKAHAEASREKRSLVYPYGAYPYGYRYATPYAFGAYATPYTYATPEFKGYRATLTKVLNNPGHAVSYRVDPVEA